MSGYQFILSVFTTLLALIAPAVPVILTTFSFIFVDTYYGYKVSTRYGKKLESRKLWKMCNKIKEALTVIVLGLLLDKYILNTYTDLTMVKVAAGVICSAESISLLESFRALYPRSLLSKILAKVIKSKSEKYLDVDLSDIIDLNKFTNDTNDNTVNNRKSQ